MNIEGAFMARRAPPSVLIVKLSSLGDILHALPAVHCIREGLGARIDWVTQPEYAELVRACPDVHAVLPFHRRAFVRTFRPWLRELRGSRYDMVIDLQGLLKSAVVARLARAGERIGPSFAREGSRFFYDRLAGRADPERHAVDQCLDIAEALGLERGAPQFPLRIPARELADERPRIAVAPLSRRSEKNWPVERYLEVMRAVRRSAGGSFYLLGSRGDAAVTADMARQLGGATIDLAGRTSLLELGGVLRGMDLLLSNDSGPMHLAAAMGTPVLAIFLATDPRCYRPYGPGHAVVGGLSALPEAGEVTSRALELLRATLVG